MVGLTPVLLAFAMVPPAVFFVSACWFVVGLRLAPEYRRIGSNAAWYSSRILSPPSLFQRLTASLSSSILARPVMMSTTLSRSCLVILAPTLALVSE